jgi:hypothetical protein
VFYTIQPGDNLLRLAQAAGVSLLQVQQANGIPDPNRIQVGQRICLPRAPNTATFTPTRTNTPTLTLTTAVPPRLSVQGQCTFRQGTLSVAFTVTNSGGPMTASDLAIIIIPQSALQEPLVSAQFQLPANQSQTFTVNIPFSGTGSSSSQLAAGQQILLTFLFSTRDSNLSLTLTCTPPTLTPTSTFTFTPTFTATHTFTPTLTPTFTLTPSQTNAVVIN